MTTTYSDPQVPEVSRPPRKPKHSRTYRVIRGLIVAFAAFMLIGGIASAFGSHKTAAAAPEVTTSAPAIQGVQAIPPGVAAPAKATPKPAAKVAPKPAVTVTAKAAPAPTVTVTAPPAAPPAPAAPAADTVLARFSGTGTANTGSFTVPADGNFHLSYEYANGSLFAGRPENFQVYEWGTDGTLDSVLVNDLAIGHGTDTAVPVYSDSEAGSTAYLQVVTEDASWSVVVLSGTS